jgi:hypothetical protein
MEAMTALLVKHRDHLVSRHGVRTMLELRDGTALGDEQAAVGQLDSSHCTSSPIW